MTSIAQSADALIAAADNLEGWGFFHHQADPELNAKQAALAEEKSKRLALEAAVLWQHNPGFRDIMEFIFDQTLRRPAYVAQLGLPMDQAYGYGAFREGQNAVADMIAKMIATGMNGTGASDAQNSVIRDQI